MKKFLTIIILLLIILATAAFLILRFSFSGSAQNYFNRQWRSNFDRSETLRNIFSLHDYGDARTDYLGSQYADLNINVYEMTGLGLDPYVADQLATKIQALTLKNVSFNIVHADLPLLPAVSDYQIDTLAKEYLLKTKSSDSAVLNLFIFNEKSDESDLLGLTYKEHGIVIFENALKTFTQPYQQTFDNYELSTILHEFGHQLGLQHNDRPGCLMNAKAELNDSPQSNPEQVVTDFCSYELNQIQK